MEKPGMSAMNGIQHGFCSSIHLIAGRLGGKRDIYAAFVPLAAYSFCQIERRFCLSFAHRSFNDCQGSIGIDLLTFFLNIPRCLNLRPYGRKLADIRTFTIPDQSILPQGLMGDFHTGSLIVLICFRETIKWPGRRYPVA